MKSKSLYFLRFEDVQQGHEQLLELSLSTPSPSPSPSSSSSLLPCIINNPNSRKRSFCIVDEQEDQEEDDQQLDSSLSSSSNPNSVGQVSTTTTTCLSHNSQARVRRNPFQRPKQGKSETLAAAPYPWATTRRATVHNLVHLLSLGITIISGDVECKGCQEKYKIEYNLEEKFKEIKDFVRTNKLSMHDRAPDAWMNPSLESCELCGNSLKPVFTKKKGINWLFLLLGKMLGCCKLSELKYFCKHTKNHRTGAKDRLLYLVYLGLCKQLDPDGHF